MITRELLDPTAERAPVERERSPRPSSLEGLTVGLLDIAKARGDVFLDRLDELLTQRGVRVVRFQKPTFAKVMPPSLVREVVASSNLVIAALAD